MKIAVFLMTFFVATMSFGKVIETSDPAYSCQVSYFKGPANGKNILSVGEEALIYSTHTTLFQAYAISSEKNFYFQYLYSQKNINEVAYSENILRVSLYKPGIRQLTVNENTGKALFIQTDAEPYILFKPEPTFKVEFINCEKIDQELVENTVLGLRMPERKPIQQAKKTQTPEMQLSLDTRE